MSNGEFDQLFQTATDAVGAEYVAARDAIVAMSDAITAQLQARATNADWRVATTAEILLGWLTNRELFEQVLAIAQADVPDAGLPLPITGHISTTRRANVITALGSAVVPRLIEIVTKEREQIGGEELEVVMLALDYLRDARAVMPLADLAGRTTDQDTQVFALAVLGSLGDERGFDVAQTLLADRSKDVIVRGAAAVALGQIGDRRATPTILAAAQDQSEARMVRENAIQALGYLGDPTASAALAALVESAPDERFSLAVVSALGDIGDPTAIAALDQINRSTSDPSVRQAAEETRRTLIA